MSKVSESFAEQAATMRGRLEAFATATDAEMKRLHAAGVAAPELYTLRAWVLSVSDQLKNVGAKRKDGE